MRKSSRWKRIAIGTAAAGALLACEKTSTAPIASSGPSGFSASTQPIDSASLQLVTRSIAIALSDESVRQQLLSDLRDSPFQNHAVEFRSYLGGSRGRSILARIAVAAGQTEEDFMRTLATLGSVPLELSMPRYGDRRNWSGGANLAVVGMAETPAEFHSQARARGQTTVQGFDTRGAPATVNLLVPDAVPAFLISPAQQDFGNDPEGVRSSAPRKDGATIGAPDEAVDSKQAGDVSAVRIGSGNRSIDPCPSGSCDDEGTTGGGSTLGPGFLYLPSGQDYAACISNGGPGEPLNATCRRELAVAFQPRPIFNTDEPCLGHATQYTTRSPGSQTIEIFYALSYFNDCHNRSGLSDDHFGDSEFIIVRVKPTSSPANGWYLANVTLSAHYGVFGGDYTWTGSPPAVEFNDYEYLQRPRVYISYGKHANYRDIGSCGRGAYWLDDCGRASAYVLPNFGIDPVGSDLGFRSAQLRNCIVPANAPGGSPECYWSQGPYGVFTGWYGWTPASTSYTSLFGDFGF
jgi:hypothetical protein